MPTTTTSLAASLDDVRAAAARIAPFAQRTPVMTCATLDRLAGCALFFKCENFQKVGAFKFRGACNAVMKLPEDMAPRGVVTHSSGNHAQALALAARLWGGGRGIPAHIVMPTTSSAVKKRAVQGYGGRVIECEPTLAARETTAARIVKETGATLIPPYDHPDIIAGQGTAALELMEQVAQGLGIRDQGLANPQPLTPNPSLDAIIAPIGGGGLMAGTCIAARGLNPSIRIIGAEPAGADDAARSLAAGSLIPHPPAQPAPRTIADGLLTSLGDLTWPIIRAHVERIITVSDEEIIHAMRLVWERMKIIIEPSSATVVAAALSQAFPSDLAGGAGARVGVILSGGNVDLDRLPWVR